MDFTTLLRLLGLLVYSTYMNQKGVLVCLGGGGCPHLGEAAVELVLNAPEDAEGDVLPLQRLPHTKPDPHEGRLSFIQTKTKLGMQQLSGIRPHRIPGRLSTISSIRLVLVRISGRPGYPAKSVTGASVQK